MLKNNHVVVSQKSSEEKEYPELFIQKETKSL